MQTASSSTVVESVAPQPSAQPTTQYENIDTLPAKEEEDDVEQINIGSSVSAPPAAVAPIDDDEEIYKRRVLLIKLSAYREKLVHKLPGIKLDELEHKPVLELEKLLKDCEFSIGIANSSSMLRELSRYTLDFTGSMFSVQGLGSTLNQVPEYVDTIHEIGIKYANFVYTDPLTRLALIVAATAQQLYTQQAAQRQTIGPFLATPTHSNVTDQYKDL